MKSKAQIKGHPLHPILLPFPLAFFIGALLFDVLGVVRESESFWRTGMYLVGAGVVFALLAATAGFIDFRYTVPPKSSAKKRAAKHGLINLTVVILYVLAFFYRRNADASPAVVLALEGVGTVLLFIGGWLGGTLVYRNQIGVDIRYAQAGKWTETHVDAPGGLVAVAGLEELKINQMKLVHVDGKRIVIGRTEEGYVAFDDRCTHKGGSLAGGALICGTVQCPWHGSQFHTKTGAVAAGPATEKIATYPTEERDGNVYIRL
ncbi:DUF2231 domain-containing protein [Paraflavisolibacter sp. H34]|uniref:DUF2231 domain-containing protein n=1 Tax=Huijunlia imazamoxiresistens TaxID=3127457 RepID=UPI0030173510